MAPLLEQAQAVRLHASWQPVEAWHCACTMLSAWAWSTPAIRLQAPFDVTIATASGLSVLFNTARAAIKDVTLPSGALRKVHTFARTPSMATYLLGIVVGQLESLSGTYERPSTLMAQEPPNPNGDDLGDCCGGETVAVSVWGRAGQSRSLQLALDVAIAALECALPHPCVCHCVLQDIRSCIYALTTRGCKGAASTVAALCPCV
jgi:hypothetical protein